MAVNVPNSAAEVDRRSKNDVKNELQQSNPFLKNSWLGAIITALSNRLFDFYYTLRQVELESIPDTAVVQMERWASIFGIDRDESTVSQGGVTFTGNLEGTIPAGTILATGSSEEYQVLDSVSITSQINPVTSAVFSGGTVTVTTTADHNLSSNVAVTIADASPADYNGTFAISVTSATVFTYAIDTSPGASSGSITATGSYANGIAQSLGFGEEANQDFATELTIQSPIVGVDDECLVAVGGLVGGVDAQSDEDLRDELLERTRNPVAHFNVSDIVTQAKTIAGVTRVFVQEAGDDIGTVAVTSITRSGDIATVTATSPHGFAVGTRATITGAVEVDYNVVNAPIIIDSTTVFHYIVANTPSTPATGASLVAADKVAIGQTIVYFMRDNDAGTGIPAAAQVTITKNKILEIKPANTADADVIVSGPTPVEQAFIFSALSPDTTTMRAAVTANLEQFFNEKTEIGVDIVQEAYNAAVFNTLDTTNGDVIISFTITTPAADITVAAGEIAVLGSITYP